MPESHKKAKRKCGMGYPSLKRQKRKDLSGEEKLAVISYALTHVYLNDDRQFLPKKKLNLAERYGISASTIDRIFRAWRTKAKEEDDLEAGILNEDAEVPVLRFENRHSASGRHSLCDDERWLLIRTVNREHEGCLSYKQLSDKILQETNTRIPASTIWDYAGHHGSIQKRIHAKPILSDKQKMARLRFVLTMVDRSNPEKFVWHDLINTIFIDEKWFYLKKIKETVLALDPDLDQDLLLNHHHVDHKEHIPKIMFIAAVCRPVSIDADADHTFTGSISCVPVTVSVAAKRASKNRARGTLETKPKSLTGQAFGEYMIEIIDDIKEKCRHMRGHVITLQMDNAKPHIAKGVMDEVLDYANTDDWCFQCVFQPARSPDLNVLDLCLFWSLAKRSDVLKRDAHNVDDLIGAVDEIFDQWPWDIQERGYGCLAASWQAILDSKGGNEHSVPHIGVRKKMSEGKDSMDFPISVAQVNELTTTVEEFYGENSDDEGDDNDNEDMDDG